MPAADLHGWKRVAYVGKPLKGHQPLERGPADRAAGLRRGRCGGDVPVRPGVRRRRVPRRVAVQAGGGKKHRLQQWRVRAQTPPTAACGTRRRSARPRTWATCSEVPSRMARWSLFTWTTKPPRAATRPASGNTYEITCQGKTMKAIRERRHHGHLERLRGAARIGWPGGGRLDHRVPQPEVQGSACPLKIGDCFARRAGRCRDKRKKTALLTWHSGSGGALQMGSQKAEQRGVGTHPFGSTEYM